MLTFYYLSGKPMVNFIIFSNKFVSPNLTKGCYLIVPRKLSKFRGVSTKSPFVSSSNRQAPAWSLPGARRPPPACRFDAKATPWRCLTTPRCRPSIPLSPWLPFFSRRSPSLSHVHAHSSRSSPTSTAVPRCPSLHQRAG
jgi:hypothetical protein